MKKIVVIILIRETLSKRISLPVINEYDKVEVMQISTVFWHFYHIVCQSIL